MIKYKTADEIEQLKQEIRIDDLRNVKKLSKLQKKNFPTKLSDIRQWEIAENIKRQILDRYTCPHCGYVAEREVII